MTDEQNKRKAMDVEMPRGFSNTTQEDIEAACELSSKMVDLLEEYTREVPTSLAQLVIAQAMALESCTLGHYEGRVDTQYIVFCKQLAHMTTDMVLALIKARLKELNPLDMLRIAGDLAGTPTMQGGGLADQVRAAFGPGVNVVEVTQDTDLDELKDALQGMKDAEKQGRH